MTYLYHDICAQFGGHEVAWDYCLEQNIIMPDQLPMMRSAYAYRLQDRSRSGLWDIVRTANPWDSYTGGKHRYIGYLWSFVNVTTGDVESCCSHDPDCVRHGI